MFAEQSPGLEQAAAAAAAAAEGDVAASATAGAAVKPLKKRARFADDA
jgi:hypothetical protein